MKIDVKINMEIDVEISMKINMKMYVTLSISIIHLFKQVAIYSKWRSNQEWYAITMDTVASFKCFYNHG